jgi:hypothetical protein
VKAPPSPINFRMPGALRSRLRRFATARHIEEAQALRVIVSEHLDEVESASELAAAERWQHAQAFATWDRFLQGEANMVSHAEIQGFFAQALAPTPRGTARGA